MNKKTKIIIIIVLVILLITISVLMIYNNQKEQDNDAQPVTSEETQNQPETSEEIDKQEEKISPEEEYANKYLDIVPKLGSGTSDYYPYDEDAYSKNKVTVTDLNKEFLASYIYLDEAEHSKVNTNVNYNFSWCGEEQKCGSGTALTEAQLQAALKEKYNISNYSSQGFSISCGSVEKKDNVYYGYCGRGASGKYPYGKFKSMTKTDDKLIITENVGFMAEYYTLVYKTRDGQIYRNLEDSDDFEAAKKYIRTHPSEFSEYKHTFLKNSTGGYYWYSTELITQ